MLNSFLKISARNLLREKLYALVNIAGLSLAIACCLVLGLYLKGEFTYDQHNTNHENIYRVVNEFTANGAPDNFAVTSAALGVLISQDFDEIEDYVTFQKSQASLLITHDDDAFFWEQSFFVTDNIFEVFDHDIIYGDPATALKEPMTAAVSETFAQRYFGDNNPIGEVISTEAGELITIRLVFADLPENSHLKYDLLNSYQDPRVALPDDMTQLRQRLFGVSNFTYLVMAEGFKPENFDAMQASFYERHMAERGSQGGLTARFMFEPLADIHFNSDMPYDEPKGNRAFLYAFSVVAIFILAVACINYTNLSTARSIRRSKEVGLRKILGANKSILMLQFLAEAMLYALISTVIAVIMVEIFMDMSFTAQLLGKDLSFSLFDDPELFVWLGGLTVGIGILAGLYPAIYLSSWAPLSALVSSGKNAGKGNIRLRQALVLTQFTISIAVIASTLLMSNQMRFISDRALGFDKDNQVAIRMSGLDLIEKSELIKNELSQHPDILGVTTHTALPGQDLPVNAVPTENEDGNLETSSITHTQVDVDYLDVMGLELVDGRDFSQRLLTDVGTAVIVNETMVRTKGWSEPLGKRIFDGRVIGVMKDFNFSSLHSLVEPLAMRPFNDNFDNVTAENRPFVQRYMTIKIASGNTRETLNYLQDRFAEFDPSHPFEYEFLDDTINEMYQSEESLMRLIGIFAGVCIFIASLGLFGLASFTTEQRNKEISIRKVLGASAGQIILLLSRSILGLVLIGAILASALAYLAIDEWLASFAYRADISITAFIIAALAALAVAYVTMAVQSYKTAQADPVDALRS